jgi:acetyl-CoA carboxylase biotin carboxyl carrier protein
VEKNVTYEDLFQIAQTISSAKRLKRFKLSYGELLIEVDYEGHEHGSEETGPLLKDSMVNGSMPLIGSQKEVAPTLETEKAKMKAVTSVATIETDTAVVVKAPMVGTCYRRPEPGAQPYVEVGQQVNEGDTLLLIEVMKLFNNINSPRCGVVKEILIDDNDPVEYGQALIVIEPNE